MRSATIQPETIEPPRWQAVGLVLDRNARDLRARRYGRLQELVSWFKGIDLFRQAEFERMIQSRPLNKKPAQITSGGPAFVLLAPPHGTVNDNPGQNGPIAPSLAFSRIVQ